MRKIEIGRKRCVERGSVKKRGDEIEEKRETKNNGKCRDEEKT